MIHNWGGHGAVTVREISWAVVDRGIVLKHTPLKPDAAGYSGHQHQTPISTLACAAGCTAQRSVPLYTHRCAAGLNTVMRILCYESWADKDSQQQLWLCSEWISALPAHGIRFYIREDRESLALLIDPHMRHLSLFDYIA